MDIKKDNEMYMQIALLTAQRSYATRLKVGCVIVKNHSIISFGWNGMPTGYDNCCEMEVNGQLVTRPEVQHAELNAIAKLCQNGYSSEGASIFISHSPCIHCALLIQKCGIREVYYHRQYRDDAGIQFLRKAGIKVERLDVPQIFSNPAIGE
jgi:dCMP deaminase